VRETTTTHTNRSFLSSLDASQHIILEKRINGSFQDLFFHTSNRRKLVSFRNITTTTRKEKKKVGERGKKKDRQPSVRKI